MKYRLIDLLACPHDRSGLRLKDAQVTKTAHTKKLTRVPCRQFCGRRNCSVAEADVSAEICSQCYSEEIVEGTLVSPTGKEYPIVGGIPRLLSARASEFIRKNKASFSLEWKYFRFGERNWGQDLPFRRELFLKGLGLGSNDLRNKLILDAGCGSGLLSMEMANSFGMEVVGVDLATGIELAYARNTNPDVHFVQGSLLELPVRDRVMDCIYCAGVLIHLPDTARAFRLLPRVLRPGGRYFVWIYRTIESHELRIDRIKEAIYHRVRTRLTSRLPIRFQEWLYQALLLPFLLKQSIMRLFGSKQNVRTWREKMQNYIDTFSPTYVNRHTTQEVERWFEEAGFANVQLAYEERYGFAMRGDLVVPVEEAETKGSVRG
ncbi:MAG: methyltransferase domain-containing protein [Verrucomicrobiota bacterium]